MFFLIGIFDLFLLWTLLDLSFLGGGIDLGGIIFMLVTRISGTETGDKSMVTLEDPRASDIRHQRTVKTSELRPLV